MDADFSVELGAEDEALEFPWSDPEGLLRYVDLKHHDLKAQPELLREVAEALEWPELGELLASINSAQSVYLTAKCDVWIQDELSEAEEIYGASMKHASYVDLLFDEAFTAKRFSFEEHESLARRLCGLLARAPEIPASAEFAIRRCYYHDGGEPIRPGFYITCYLFGYGDDAAEARQRWGIALSLTKNALLQLAAEMQRTE